VLADVQVVVVVRSPDLESVFSHVLSVQQQALDGGAVRFVVHVDLETISIISLRVRRDECSLKSSAESRHCVAE